MEQAPVQEREDYWSGLRAADRYRSLGAVKRLRAAGVSACAILEGLVVPAQERIGELWLAGEWSIAQEHAATAVNETVVHWLTASLVAPDDGEPPVLVSCVQGERHALPALVVAAGLSEAGLRVHYLGADPEPDDLLHQVLRLDPRAACFSASLSSTLATAKGLFARVRATGVPVVAGGRAFGGDPDRALALGATAYAGDLTDAVRVIRDLPCRPGVAGVGRAGDGGGSGEVGDARPAEEEGAWIVERTPEIVPLVARAMAAHGARGEVPAWHADVPDHARYLLGSLAAALVADDDAILVEAREWLGVILQTRGAAPGTLEDLWATVGRPLRGHPLARVFLARTAPSAERAPRM